MVETSVASSAPCPPSGAKSERLRQPLPERHPRAGPARSNSEASESLCGRRVACERPGPGSLRLAAVQSRRPAHPKKRGIQSLASLSAGRRGCCSVSSNRAARCQDPSMLPNLRSASAARAFRGLRPRFIPSRPAARKSSRHGEIRPEGGPVSLRAGRTTRPRRSLRLDHAPTSLTHQTGRGRQRRGQDHLLLAPRTPAVSRRPFRGRFDRGPAENACVDLSRGGCFAWCPPEVSRPAGSVARTSFPL
jgi:hypothetical protein